MARCLLEHNRTGICSTKKSIRIVNALEYNAHTTSYFRNMQALKLPDLYKYHLLIFVYKSLILKENVNVATLRQNLENHEYNTREREAITIPPYKRVESQFPFRYAAAKAWNGLPANIKSCTSLTMFKTALKQYICSSYWLSYCNTLTHIVICFSVCICVWCLSMTHITQLKVTGVTRMCIGFLAL